MASDSTTTSGGAPMLGVALSGDIESLMARVSDHQIKMEEVERQQQLEKEADSRRRQEAYERRQRERMMQRERLQRRERAQRLKRIPCRFYMVGKCLKGADCPFRHEGVEISRKHDLCRYHLVGACSKGDLCPFIHDFSQWPCKFYHLYGSCAKGKECPFSHAEISDEERQQLAEHTVTLEEKKSGGGGGGGEEDGESVGQTAAATESDVSVQPTGLDTASAFAPMPEFTGSIGDDVQIQQQQDAAKSHSQEILEADHHRTVDSSLPSLLFPSTKTAAAPETTTIATSSNDRIIAPPEVAIKSEPEDAANISQHFPTFGWGSIFDNQDGGSTT